MPSTRSNVLRTFSNLLYLREPGRFQVSQRPLLKVPHHTFTFVQNRTFCTDYVYNPSSAACRCYPVSHDHMAAVGINCLGKNITLAGDNYELNPPTLPSAVSAYRAMTYEELSPEMSPRNQCDHNKHRLQSHLVQLPRVPTPWLPPTQMDRGLQTPFCLDNRRQRAPRGHFDNDALIPLLWLYSE